VNEWGYSDRRNIAIAKSARQYLPRTKVEVRIELLVVIVLHAKIFVSETIVEREPRLHPPTVFQVCRPLVVTIAAAVFRVVRLLIFGFIGWLWFMSANDSTWKVVSLAAVLAVAMLVGVPWYLTRAPAPRGGKQCKTPVPNGGGGLRWMLMQNMNRNRRRGLTHGGTFMLVLSRKIGERIPSTLGNDRIECNLNGANIHE